MAKKYKMQRKDCGLDSRLHAEWEIWCYPNIDPTDSHNYENKFVLRKDDQEVLLEFSSIEDVLLAILNLNDIDLRIREQGMSSTWAHIRYSLEEVDDAKI